MSDQRDPRSNEVEGGPELGAEFPEKLECLFVPKRYKVLHGGRGGAKSWGVARALLIIAAERPLRVLCARELQTSLKDSVHQLLDDQIEDLGMKAFYDVQNASIKGLNGTEFTFAGLKNNVKQIKSMEGIDVAWVEEAATVSKTSWNTLIPTIRKEGSEIWITFNPELAEDETYQRFVVRPPENAIVQRINWSDNPWFPETLRLEKDALKLRDPIAYDNVWEGAVKRAVEGAVFGKQMSDAETEGRISRVAYDATKPVHRVWDLGWSDNVATWFLQMIGMEMRVIRYAQGNQRTITDYLTEYQQFGYLYDTDWMPHDADNKTLAANGKSIRDIMVAANCKVRVLPRVPVTDSINAARTIFPNCWFDRENTADGLQCLRHYQYAVDPDSGLFSKEPLHNWASHGADAFRMMGLMVSEPRKVRKAAAAQPNYEQHGWMG